MATDYTIPKDEYRALMAERDKLLDGFHAMQQLYEDELKHALAENTKLRAERDHMLALRDTWQENDAKLREENERLRSVVSDGADNAREILAESRKLRELCGFMLRCISQYHDCADCLVNGEHCEISYIESDARELGIEV